jgi:hypothetical protein
VWVSIGHQDKNAYVVKFDVAALYRSMEVTKVIFFIYLKYICYLVVPLFHACMYTLTYSSEMNRWWETARSIDRSRLPT